MEIKGNIADSVLLPWLKQMKAVYEEKGMIPTIELLIEEIEEQRVWNNGK